MGWIPWLILGFILGWLVELFFDWSFWRNRRICAENEVELNATIDNLRTRNTDLDGRLAAFGNYDPAGIATMEADLKGARARIGELEADINTRDVELGGLRVKANEYADFESKLGSKGWTLGGFLGGLTASSLWNRWSDRDGDIDLDAEFGRIGEMEADLELKNGRIADLEGQLGRLGDLEADLNLKNNRIAELEGQLGELGDLRADLDFKNGRIGDLEADLDAKVGQIGSLEGELGGLRAKAGEFAEFESKLGAKGLTLGGFLGGFTASRFWDRWSDRDGDIDLDAELGRIGDLEGDLELKNNRIVELEGQLGRIGDLEADLNLKNNQIADLEGQLGGLGDLQADLDVKTGRIGELEGELGGLRAKADELADFEAKLGAKGLTLGGFLGGFTASRFWDRWSDQDGDIDLEAELGRVGDLEGDLGQRDAQISMLENELGILRSQLEGASDLQTENGNLKNMVSMLEETIEDKDAELFGLVDENKRIGELEAEFGLKDARISMLEKELDIMRAKNEEVAEFEAKLGSKGMTLGSFATGFAASSFWNNWNRAEADGDGFDFDADLNATAPSLDIDIDGDGVADSEAEIKDARIAMLENELEIMRAKNEEVADFEAKLGSRGMTLGSFATGFTASSFWNNWNRAEADGDGFDFDADLNATAPSLDIDIDGDGVADSEAEIKDARITMLENELDIMRAKSDEIADFEAKLGAKGMTLGSFTSGFAASSFWNNWNRAEADGDGFDFDAELNATAPSLGLEADTSDLEARIAELEDEVEDKDAEIFGLVADNNRLLDVETAFNANVGDAEVKDSRIAMLEKELDIMRAKSDEIADFEAKLGDKGMTLGSFATGFTASSFWNNWNRAEADGDGFDFDADLNATAPSLDIDVDGDGVADSEAEIKDARITMLENELDIMRAKSDEIADFEAKLGAKGMTLGSFATGFTASSFWNNWNRAEADADAGTGNFNFDADLNAAAPRLGLQADTSEYTLRISELEAELETMRSSKGPDDLTKIWGIGPKIAGLLNDNGITTFQQLADTNDEKVAAILESGGSRYRLSDPNILSTWNEQAQLAADGNMSGLKSLQDTLKGRRGTVSNPLRKIWGVGAKTEKLLNSAGINDFNDLLSAPEGSLDAAIESAKGYYPNMDRDAIYRSWIEQSRLGSDAKWAQLRGFQQQYRTERRRDDLTRLWGVGPGLNRILNRRGIDTYEEFATLSEDQAKEIVREAGLTKAQLPDDYYNVWMEQARFAIANDWDGWANYVGGRRRDDLKLIWGIGPKIEEVLNNSGIWTFEALANIDPNQVEEILQSSGSRFSLSSDELINTWDDQARFAATDDWEKFQELYDSLTWENVNDGEEN